MQRNKYSKEFKLWAINQVLQEGKTISKVSKDLGIISTMLSRWIYEYKNNGDSAFSGNGVKIKNKDFEIEALKKKIKELESENEVLKKFQAFLKEQNNTDLSL